MSKTALIILDHKIQPDHQDPVKLWSHCFPKENILLAWGGDEESFHKIKHDQKILIKDPRLKVQDLQREKMSYTETFQTIYPKVIQKKPTQVLFVEGDCRPVRKDLEPLLVTFLKEQKADAVFSRLVRIDDTNHPHYLSLIADSKFHTWLEKTSIRKNKKTTLKAICSPILMSTPAFQEICHHFEPFPIHSEEYFPTLLHHQGFRVVNLDNHNDYTLLQGKLSLDKILQEAWLLHPVKRFEGKWLIKTG